MNKNISPNPLDGGFSKGLYLGESSLGGRNNVDTTSSETRLNKKGGGLYEDAGGSR